MELSLSDCSFDVLRGVIVCDGTVIRISRQLKGSEDSPNFNNLSTIREVPINHGLCSCFDSKPIWRILKQILQRCRKDGRQFLTMNIRLISLSTYQMANRNGKSPRAPAGTQSRHLLTKSLDQPVHQHLVLKGPNRVKALNSAVDMDNSRVTGSRVTGSRLTPSRDTHSRDMFSKVTHSRSIRSKGTHSRDTLSKGTRRWDIRSRDILPSSMHNSNRAVVRSMAEL